MMNGRGLWCFSAYVAAFTLDTHHTSAEFIICYALSAISINSRFDSTGMEIFTDLGIVISRCSHTIKLRSLHIVPYGALVL